MKINKSIVAVVCMLLGSLKGFAQQDPQYTQYMYSQNVINPAYAGINDYLSTGVLYRAQWLGMKNAPSTGTVSLHTPVAKNVGVGATYINVVIGPVHEKTAISDVVYTIRYLTKMMRCLLKTAVQRYLMQVRVCFILLISIMQVLVYRTYCKMHIMKKMKEPLVPMLHICSLLVDMCLI